MPHKTKQNRVCHIEIDVTKRGFKNASKLWRSGIIKTLILTTPQKVQNLDFYDSLTGIQKNLLKPIGS